MADPGSWAAVLMAVSAVGSTAYGIATAPGSPSYSAPPPPPNYTTYGEDGEILSRQVYDSATNTWTTYSGNAAPEKPAYVSAPGAKPDSNGYYTSTQDDYGNQVTNFDRPAYEAAMRAWETDVARYDKYQKDLAEYEPKLAEYNKAKEERAAEKAKLADLRSTALGNLNELTPERQAQIEKFGTDFAASMRKETDEQFQKIGRTYDEKANATGMFGSRAYADTQAEMAKDKMDTETDIAQQATMAKEQLTSADRQYWSNLLSQIDAGQRSDLLTQANINKANSDTASQNYAGTLGYYNALNVPKLANWQNNLATSQSYTSAGSNLAGGLMYLYGMNQGGKVSAPSTPMSGTSGYKSNFGLKFSG